jgi:Ca-activated chloride channel family protein
VTGTTRARAGLAAAVAGVLVSVVAFGSATAGQERPSGQGFSFKTGVELINVSATVTDEHGRFVSGLRARDFLLYEDGTPQAIQQFDAERVPVSLGIALDTSGSMIGDKIVAAQAALHRFLFDLLTDQDQVFLYRFDGRPHLIQSWTDDRRAAGAALGSIKPSGGTAIYDTIDEALPLIQTGTRRKKALVVISDGNDTSSRIGVNELSDRIRAAEVIVYAIGVDASGGSSYSSPSTPRTIPTPAPFPGRTSPPQTAKPPAPRTGSGNSSSSVDRINADALRKITDDSGGRTEIIVSARDLDPATAGIADELSRQYFLGYSSSVPKDGRWHTIELKLARPGNYAVRARKGFVAN